MLQALPCTCTVIGLLLEKAGWILHLFPLSKSLLILSTLPCHSHLPLLCSACLHLFSRGYSFLAASADWKILSSHVPESLSSHSPLPFSILPFLSFSSLSFSKAVQQKVPANKENTQPAKRSFHGFFCFDSLEFWTTTHSTTKNINKCVPIWYVHKTLVVSTSCLTLSLTPWHSLL